MPELVDICSVEDLPPGATRVVEAKEVEVVVTNCDGAHYAIENRCSHDDGPLAEGPFDARACTLECPRHGSIFDLRTGRPLTLPAYEPVDTFPIVMDGDRIQVEVD